MCEEDLPDTLRPPTSALEAIRFTFPPQGVDLEAVERELLSAALEAAQGNQSRAAELLQISRRTLRYRMEKHELRKDNGDEEDAELIE